MRWLVCIALAVTFASVACVNHYRLQGHIPHQSNGYKLSSKETKELVKQEIFSVYSGAVVSKLREVPRRSTQNVPSSMFIEVEVTLYSQMSDTIFESKKVRFTSYKEIDAVKNTNLDAEPDCYNDGYKGPDGGCICPEQYTGYNCAILNCYHGGMPDYYLDIPQCFCPPGYNDFFCANRGCLPAVQDDINPPSTNLIIVMPAVQSFNNSRQDIMQNFEFLVNALNTYEDTPWLGLFIGVNYWSTIDYPDETYTDIIMTSNLTEFINRMITIDNLQLRDELDEAQSLLYAIDISLWDTFDGQVFGYPMVWGYSNAVNKRDDYIDSFTSQANYWRAKVFINIINDNTTQINTTAKGFTDYHSYSGLTHSPVLYYTSDEIDVIHSTVLTRIYKPQYIDVRSQITDTGVIVEAMRDYQDYSRLMQVLVTSNQPMDQGNLSLITLVGNISIPSDTSDSYFAIYTLPATSWDGFSYIATPGSTFSFYTFISSSETALWAGHDDSNTDIGDVITNAEAGYHFAVTPVAFKKPVIGIDYQSMDSSNASIIYRARYLNSKPGCTLNYEFEKISHCVAGTFVHQVTLFTENGAVTRVYPGYCAHTLTLPTMMPNEAEISFSVKPPMSTTASAPQIVCPVEGTMAFADNRNHPFRDFIFAVEWSDNDYSLILDVSGIIPDLLDAVYDIQAQQRFTFIIFNKKSVKTVVSHTRRLLFEQRVTTLINEEITDMLKDNMNETETTSDSIDSVIMANLQTLNPKGQAYIFTKTVSQQSRSNLLQIYPKSFQINYFYHTDVYDSYPFSLYTRQTGGRWYSSQYPGYFISAFLPETVKSVLIYNEVYQAPLGMPFTYSFLVEKSATALEVLMNGALQNFTLLDSTGSKLHYNSSFDGNMGMIVADLTNRSTETYTLNVECTYCTIQIRVASPLRVILGFTADLDDDTKYQTEPSAWLRMDLDKFSMTYVAARVTGLDPTESITSFKITAMMGSFRGPSFTANTQAYNSYMHTQMQLRNSTQCSYQWIGQIQSFYEPTYWTEELDGTKFLIEIKTDKGMEYTRMVYYYLPAELKNGACPNFATLDGHGVCQCTANFTGELCTVPVCQNSGVENFGACNCNPGTAGRFCEIVITNLYYGNDTTTVVPTTSMSTQPTSTMKATNLPVSSTQSTKVSTMPPVTPAVTQQTNKVTQPSSTAAASTTQAYQSTQASKTSKIPVPPPATTPKSTGSLLIVTTIVYTLLCFF